MGTKAIIIGLFLISSVHNHVSYITEQIVNEIYLQNKIYFLYVGVGTKFSPKLLSIFEEACVQGMLCATVNRSSRHYDFVQESISYDKKQQYFVIYDFKKGRKFILQAECSLTTEDLTNFYQSYQQTKLVPYLSNEQLKTCVTLSCQKIVAGTLKNFLNSKTPIKVLFLEAGPLLCKECSDIRNFFCDFAKKMYDAKLILFGYYDVYKNDSPLIEEQQMPYFYIYRHGYPLYKISAKKKQLLHQIVMDVVLQYTQTGMQEDTIILQSSGIPAWESYDAEAVLGEKLIQNQEYEGFQDWEFEQDL